jgi:carboxymethylenebutenolidase
VSPTDARVKNEFVEFASPAGNGKVRALVARPAQAAGTLPVVLVVHENRGLNPHIEDVARRLALDGFVAFAPDALFPLGGYPGDEDKARELFSKLDQAKIREDFIAAAAVLKARAECTGTIGAVGFCYGGGMVNYLATRLGGDLSAAVCFYGSAPDTEDVPKIKAPLMVHSAEKDERINASWPEFERALKAAKVKYRALPVSRHAARLQQRHDAAVRRGRGQARLEEDARVLREAPALAPPRNRIRIDQDFREADSSRNDLALPWRGTGVQAPP